MVIVPLRVRPFAKNVSTLRVLPSAPNDQNPVGAALVAARLGLWARQPRTRYCRASPGRPQEAPLQVAARRGGRCAESPSPTLNGELLS